MKNASGYRLDVREIAVRGGDSGEAAIVPASSQASRLLGSCKDRRCNGDASEGSG